MTAISLTIIDSNNDYRVERACLNDGEILAIGRNARTNDISVREQFVSDNHGIIVCDGGRCYYKDINKSNGSYVNAFNHVERLNKTDRQILLNDGTLIMFENMINGPYVYLTVDLNGIKNPPNIMGYDTFAFQLIDGELLAMGDRGTGWTGEQYCDIDKILRLTKNISTASGAPYGHSCAHYAKVDADYFKKVVKKYKY